MNEYHADQMNDLLKLVLPDLYNVFDIYCSIY